jgi:hypothetical protein
VTRFNPLKAHIAFINYPGFFISPGYIVGAVFTHLQKSGFRYFLCALGEYNRSGFFVDNHCVFYIPVSRYLAGRLGTVSTLVREKIPDHTIFLFKLAKAYDFVIITI